MSPEPTENKCNACDKPQSEFPNPLRRCARCKTQRYCSRECQRADWKAHKANCSNPVPEPTSNTCSTSGNANTTSKGPCYIHQPFTAINNGTWLLNRPEKDVFTLLVDVYRLRVEDQYKFEGDIEEGSLYSGASAASALRCFQRFLTQATKADATRSKRVLPEWWSQKKLKECVEFAKSDGWANVGYAVEKHDIQEHYEESLMPMQLRMFGEKLDGTLTGGTSGASMLQMQLMVEGGGMISSHLSLS